MARAGGWERVALHGQVPEHPTPHAAGAQHFAMDAGEDVGEAPAAGRPAPLLEVLPQERVQQRTAEQIVDPVPVVPLLHDVVPQMVEQLVDFLTPLDFPVPEQVIEVPMIVCPPRAARTVLGVPQTVEQVVEAPTIVSYSSLQRNMEQNVDIPVPGRGGRSSGLQALLSGQSSTASQLAQERISERLVEQIVDIPVSGGGLQDFRPGQEGLDEPCEGFFSHFSPEKKCACRRESECGAAPGGQLMDSGGLWCSSSPVCWSSLPPALTRRLRLHPVQCGGRVRRCCVWWLSGACLVAGALRRSSVRDVLFPDGSGRQHRGGG